MNEFYLNDHSVHGQYSTANAFKAALELVLNARTSVEQAGFRFFTDTRICQRITLNNLSFYFSVLSLEDRQIQSIVLAWLSKSGPFWKDQQSHSANDVFDCLNYDVADSAIAEAAFRHSQDTPCDLFCFAPSKFTHSPLAVRWERSTGGEVGVSIRNFWELATLSTHLATLTPIKDWVGLFDWAKRSCKHLLFSDNTMEPILCEPFSYAAAQEIQELLLVLNELSNSHSTNGALNEHGMELHKIHFQGHRTRFSSEAYNVKFNFKHPTTNDDVQCPWHGKVRLGLQYRIHFQWPKPRTMDIWVPYIGPKLTKQ